MRHRAIIFLAMLTIVLLAGWLRSGRIYDALAHARYFTLRHDLQPRCEILMLSSINGRIELQRTRVVYPTEGASPRSSAAPAGWLVAHYRAIDQLPYRATVGPVGFSTWSGHRSVYGADVDGWRLSMPYAFLTALAAAAPIWRCTRSLRRAVVGRRRLARGACRGCGYDLRASPGRCPECGVARVCPLPRAD